MRMHLLLAFGLVAACEGDSSGPQDCGPDDVFDGDDCLFPGAPGPTGFPDNNNSDDDTARGFGICNARQASPCDNLSNPAEMTGLTCCSDDPAAVGGALPALAGRGAGAGFAAPYFAGVNNAVGTSGMCVDTQAVANGLADVGAEGCPVPCNPTWTTEDVQTVCGAARVCCQTRQLEASDCIVDGDTTRPVTGADVPDRSDWAAGRHATHQDPNGTACATIAGATNSPEFLDCVEQLSVANQRGFCVEARSCPSFAQPC